MKLVFEGVVQGVGFRPTIFNVAKKLGLKGYVLNKGSEVEVVIDKDKEIFLKELKKHLPSIANITKISEFYDNREFDDFRILYSKHGHRKSQIPADVGICKKCQAELFEKSNKRYMYPFTNCTVCGARYSLIEDVPYDRERTSMNQFPLCLSCQKEYKDPTNRRYHAQTISCPVCGPKYRIYDKNKKELESKDPIRDFANYIDNGKIGVIKSWGGMHLCCNTDEITRFRKWYNRPYKAFAVMVKDIEVAREYANISEKEKNLLTSRQKPIVLVEKKKCEEASPGLDTIGLFLPYTALHHILFDYMSSDAIVMTSANIPGEAMITSNNDAFAIDADYYLLHDRKIPNRVDDSVIRIWKDNYFFLRKSRGFIPDPIPVKYKKNVISVGAGENVYGAVSSDKNIFLTQYIGNSKYYSTLVFLKEAIQHLIKLNMEKKQIDAVAMDLHPAYDTSKIAHDFAEKYNAPLFEVLHHWAHAASLQVEHDLDECIVLALDGLGYGDDKNFWGGEVIYSNYEEYKRLGHLEYIPLIGGDMAAIDTRRLVYAIYKKLGKTKYFTGRKDEIFSKMIKKAPLSSAMGRVLDAISCYLGICCRRTYDGEPAMKLEKYLALGKPVYDFDVKTKNGIVQTVDLFDQFDKNINARISEKDKADLSYSMVKSIIDSLAEIAIKYAQENKIKNVGVSGGVSYNIPINNMLEEKLKDTGLRFFVHNRVPNGDGGVAVGQNAIAANKLI